MPKLPAAFYFVANFRHLATKKKASESSKGKFGIKKKIAIF
jgi:hypothetical protein